MKEAEFIRGSFFRSDRTHETFTPIVRVSLVTSKGVSKEVDAVFDTGSIINLATMDTAVSLLQRTVEEIMRGNHVRFKGAGGGMIDAWGWQASVRLRGTTASQTYVEIKRAMIYATDGSVPYSGVVIGQKDGLQGRNFYHLNCLDRRKQRTWTLRPAFR